MTVVGVVGDVHMNAWDPYVLPALYGSIDQVESAAAASASFVVRRDNTPRGSVVDMRSAMKTFDPGLPGPDVLPMTDIIRRSLDQRRLLATTLSAFAAVTTLLAIVGLHGMLAHAVALRTREIGVRLALGARPANVVARVMRDGLFVAVPGLVGGVLSPWHSSVVSAPSSWTSGRLTHRCARLRSACCSDWCCSPPSRWPVAPRASIPSSL